MTVLENSIRIEAPPEKVWSVMARIDLLERYDPGVLRSVITGGKEGLGSARRCDLKAGGWFEEKITAWKPTESLAFELVACTLPVKALKHSYTLAPDGPSGTVVTQRMEYELKMGPIGSLMDWLMVRKKWDEGVKGFFEGLKRYVETEINGDVSKPAVSAHHG